MVVTGACMPTASVMFRRSLIDRLPPGFRTVMNADTYLYCFGGQFGPAGFVDVKPSAYRHHEGGIWSRRKQEFRMRSNLHTFQTLLAEMDRAWRRPVEYRICQYFNRIIAEQLASFQFARAAKTMGEYVAWCLPRLGIRMPWYQARWMASCLSRLVRRSEPKPT